LDNEPAIIRVPSPRRQGPSVVLVLAAALVALAILKPWGIGASSGPPTTTRSSLPASASAGPPSTPIAEVAVPDPNAMACMSSEGDRLLALLRAPGLEVRTWLTLNPSNLADPADPSVVPLRLPTSHVIGLGVCARRTVQESSVASAAEIVDVVLVTTPGPVALTDLGAPVVITRQPGPPSLGVLYGPPAGLVSARSPAAVTARPPSNPGPGAPDPSAGAESWPIWPAGSYALAFRYPADPPSVVRWVRLDIVPAVGKYG